ncbi:MAG: hypothetical protein QOK25_101 [Thermoleophilaceae bacterium]|nr:hypothetical protein [Thermoleophilaceae bacterium]
MERIPRLLAAGAFALVAVVACAVALAGQPARAAAPSDVLPNLVADPPDSASLDYYSYSSPPGGHDLLLRFDGYVHNAGPGALEVRGSRASTTDPMTPIQRVYRTDGSYRDDQMPSTTQLFYSNADGHQHWHLQNIARYSLWNQGKTAEVAPAQKVGFCLDDSTHVDSVGPSSAVYTDANGRNFCQWKTPSALSLWEGVSAGWRDVYYSSLSLQWVVVSDVQPGRYWLREDVDPTNVVHESNETNAPAWSASMVTIPGYVAKAITAPDAPYGQSQQITLDATTYGSPGARAFRIATPPAHGTLNVASGTSFSGPTVTYTPARGYSGPDQFTYEATDSTSPYPIHPGTATVALSVAAGPFPRVAIDNAPTVLQTGTGTQLHATVTNDLPGVTWSVDGVDGGSPTAGWISPTGFYTAPSATPPAGQVTIAARSASGAHDQRVLKIVLLPPPGPSPGTKGSGRSKGILGSIDTALQGRMLAASVTPKRAGVVRLGARIDRHRLGSCSARTPKGRRFTCRLQVPTGLQLGRLKIVAQLIRHHKTIAKVHRIGAP